MPFKIRFVPPLAGFLLGLGLGILLIAALSLPRIASQAQVHTQNYGQMLARMTANQAIEASFNNDLVALQAILQEVIQSPDTRLATIHDVENNLLVQAGDARNLDSTNTKPYVAPIVLHDSIAGYTTVHLQHKGAVPGLLMISSMLLPLVFFALATGLLYRSGALVFTTFQAEPGGQSRQPEQTDKTPQPPAIEADKVYAVVQLKNLAVLRQQLNGENLRKTLGRVEQTIGDVLALYGGAGYEFREDCFYLRFYANDASNEALFRAACSAWLIVELVSIVDTIPLDLAAFVSANPLDLAPANLPIAGLVLETQAAADDLISRRLKFLEVGSEDGRIVVAGFVQPFQSLLEKQRSQLSLLSEGY